MSLGIPAVSAEDFVWQPTCEDNKWWTMCQGDRCDEYELYYLWLNNWGRSLCNEPPPFPGPGDRVFLNGYPVLLEGHADVLGVSIDTGGNLRIQGGLNLFSLSISTNGSLHIQDDTGLQVNGPTITNAGTISLEGEVPGSCLTAVNDPVNYPEVHLTGCGFVTMSDCEVNRIGGSCLGTPCRLINEDNEIRGAGQIGWNGMALTNRGLIEANQPTPLSILGGADVLLNEWILRASDGGTLLFSYGSVANTAGRIEADGGTLRVENTFITGGRIDLTNASEMHLGPNSSGLAQVTVTCGAASKVYAIATELEDVDIDCDIQIDEGQTTRLLGAIVNRGNIALTGGEDTWHASHLSMGRPEGWSEVTLKGGGYITMSDSTMNLIQQQYHSHLVNEDNTIRGAGTIDVVLTNRGLIEANQPTQLVLQCAGCPSPELHNEGTLRAAGGGTLMLSVMSVDNIDGTIESNNLGSIVWIYGTTIAGGTLTANGGMVQLDYADASLTNEVTITDGGQIELNGMSSLLAPAMTMDATAALTVRGTRPVTLSERLTFAMMDESKWLWEQNAVLTMTGGEAGCYSSSWATLEVGGTDQGKDTGYEENFDLADLVLAEGAGVKLVDWEDNGNRVDLKPEALYADSLILRTGATLNLDGLHLYVGGEQITPGPRDGGWIVDTSLMSSADFDQDCDVDADDLAVFEACATGPAILYDPATLPALPPGCTLTPDGNAHIAADFDADRDVDQSDFGAFQRCWSGENNWAYPGCASTP